MPGHDFEWFLSHADAFESLTVDQVNALSRGELVEYGDTATEASADEESEAASAVAAENSEVPPATAEVEAASAGITSELESARAKADQFETLAKTQAELIENMKSAKAADAGTGETTAQEDVLKEFKEQYPDMAAILAPALQKAIDAGVSLKTAELKRELTAALEPLQKSAQATSVESHFTAITDKVPDFETLRDSGEVDKWIESLPSYARKGAEAIMKEGTASEVIELFTQYKATLGAPAAPIAPTKAELDAKAAEVIAKAKGTKPISSTDIPASQVGIVAKEPTTVTEWSQKFAGMSPDAILKML